MLPRPMRTALAALVLLVTLGGCADKEFKCESHRQCIDKYGASGLCLQQHCAFPANDCPTGYKFDDAAGDVAGQCVEAALLPDAGPAADARPADAGP